MQQARRASQQPRSLPCTARSPTWSTPGYTATDLNAGRGDRTVEEGARAIVAMATLDDDGPSGTFVNDAGPVPW
jgi:hypothetical protein